MAEPCDYNRHSPPVCLPQADAVRQHGALARVVLPLFLLRDFQHPFAFEFSPYRPADNCRRRLVQPVTQLFQAGDQIRIKWELTERTATVLL